MGQPREIVQGDRKANTEVIGVSRRRHAAVQGAAAGAALLAGGVGLSALLQGHSLTQTWAFVALLLMAFGLRYDWPGLRWSGCALLVMASARVLIWHVLPVWFGLPVSAPLERVSAFAVSILVCLLGAWGFSRIKTSGLSSREGLVAAALPLLAGLLVLVWITLEVLLAHEGRHDARIAGHREMAIAGVWGLFGLVLALIDLFWPDQRLRTAVRGVLVAALSYLTLGALLGNARWALPHYRYPVYLGTLGAIWLSEWLFRRHKDDADVTGILPLTAAACGLLVVEFEVVRLLEPTFAMPVGEWPTAEQLRWQYSVHAFWSLTAASLYALGVMVAGAWLRSRHTRSLAAILFALAGVGLLWPHPPGLDAPLPLWVTALLTLILTSVPATAIGLRALRVERLPDPLVHGRYHSWLMWLPAFSGLASGLGWIVFALLSRR